MDKISFKISLPIFLFSLACLANFHAQKTNKVLILGIDGCRVDALEKANTPNLDSLRSQGIFCSTSWHLGKTKSGPGWSSMLTGVWDPKHRVHDNRFSNHNFKQHPFFPSYLTKENPAFTSAIIVGWKSLYHISSKFGWGESHTAKNDDGCLLKTIEVLQNSNPDVLMIHFDNVDFTGHISGFEPDNEKYIRAIETVDAQIGKLLYALKNRPEYLNENWLILSSTDHGGTGLNHSGNSVAERKIWWLASSPSLPVLEITATDPGSLFYPELPLKSELPTQYPAIVDITATALDHLLPGGLDPKLPLDGKSWLHLNPPQFPETWGAFTVSENDNKAIFTGKNLTIQQTIDTRKK